MLKAGLEMTFMDCSGPDYHPFEKTIAIFKKSMPNMITSKTWRHQLDTMLRAMIAKFVNAI
jgi:hypothetical protein